METAITGFGFYSRLAYHLIDRRQQQAVMARRDHTLDLTFRPREHRLDRSVSPVADPTVEAETLRLFDGPCLQPDALHPPANTNVNTGAGFVHSNSTMA